MTNKPSPAPPRSRFARLKVTESNVTVGSSLYDKYHRNRYDYDRQQLISDALRSFRLNPLARRIVKLYRQFSIGVNLRVEMLDPRERSGKRFTKSRQAQSNTFIQQFWKHPVNNLDEQIPEWFDERTLTGNLFLLFSVDASGMPLVRAIPSEMITGIDTRENDYRQETAYHTGALEQVTYAAYDASGTIKPPFVRHYVINRPVGSMFGESDLFPILPWIGKYNGWLENRATLNHYRSLFSWVLSGDFKSEADRAAREKQLQAQPPVTNSVLVKSNNEEWSTLSPNLDSYEAQQDGLAMKKYIAAGAGVPLHFLAEPESSTRTTAEAAGTPAFRNFQDYQQSFFNLLRDVLTIACTLRRQVDAGISAAPEFAIHGQDISERDNSVLALSLQRAVEPLGDLYDRHMIDTREYLRMAYSFAGEVYDEEKDQPEGLRRPLSNRSKKPSPSSPQPKTDPETGETISEEEG